jgi:hypothetical protein
VEPAPLIVADPPLLALDELEDGAAALELLLELLEPQAASPSVAAARIASDPNRRVSNFVSLIM